jgi:uncharacterized protein YggE
MKIVLALLACSVSIFAQVVTRSTVTAIGTGTVLVAPDRVKIDTTVVTQGTTAADAAAQNATRTAAVVAALQKLLGANADIKTINYALSPVYKYFNDGTPPNIIGFTVSVTIEVTVGDTTLAGPIIDTAAGAGATSIGTLQFTVKDPSPSQQQALKLATADAMNHANAMAIGAGRSVGPIISIVQTGATPTVILPGAGAGATSSATQVTPGAVEITAFVTLQATLN